MGTMEYAVLNDIALVRFLFVCASALFVLIFFRFRLRLSPYVTVFSLLFIMALALSLPFINWLRFWLYPGSPWVAQMMAQQKNLAYFARQLEWAVLGSVCGIFAAFLLGLAGKDLWSRRE